MQSDCEKMKDQIADLVTGILSEAQMQETEQHLSECATCRDYASALHSEDALMTEFVEKMDTNMTRRQERVLETIEISCQFRKNQPPLLWRTIMKNPITKIAVAAAVIAVVVLGLLEFIGDGATSGIVWAEVAKKVEASRGVIFRARNIGSRDPNDDWPNGYRIFWRSPAVSRMDVYRGGQIYRSIYLDYDGKTTIGVLHDAKMYSKEPMSDQTSLGDRGWSDPQGLLKLALSVEHHALGQRTIDGVLCEGIEATGPDGSTGQLWAAVETGYPVLVEIEATKGDVSSTGSMDQFQWNVDLWAQGVEPEIPANYESLGLEGEMKTLSEQGKKELLKVEQTIVNGSGRMRVHVYRYQLSDGQIKDMRECAEYTVNDWDHRKEFGAQLDELRELKKAGPGEDLGTYEETVEGRVFFFNREKYLLSDGTEVIWSVGTPKDGR